ncbi:response regulator [Halalkalibaculum sp. DA384]|uniref:response regulator n=1 Tax=Halalkalibaculum sp. DA384 TaxID=3373606 RepID=UPI003754FDC3
MKKINILIAEDNRINQVVTQKILEREGFSVSVVETGLEAVKAVKNNRYDVVLMDIQMPEMNGYEATAEIRKQQQGDDESPVIIALTASGMETEKKACMDAGMDGYLSKPINKNKLIKTLMELEGDIFHTA